MQLHLRKIKKKKEIVKFFHDEIVGVLPCTVRIPRRTESKNKIPSANFAVGTSSVLKLNGNNKKKSHWKKLSL